MDSLFAGASSKSNVPNDPNQDEWPVGNPRRRAALIVSVSLAAVVAGIGGVAYVSKVQGDRAVETAYTETVGCLFGAPPATANDAGLRARRLQLEAARQGVRAPNGTAWPERCEAPVREFQKQLLRAGSTSQRGLLDAVDSLLRATEGNAGAESIAEPAQRFYAEGLALALHASSSSHASENASPGAFTATLDTFPDQAFLSDGSGPLGAVHVVGSNPTEVRFAVGSEHGSGKVCTVVHPGDLVTCRAADATSLGTAVATSSWAFAQRVREDGMLELVVTNDKLGQRRIGTLNERLRTRDRSGNVSAVTCERGNDLVARVESVNGDFLTFLRKGEWSAPVTSPGNGGLFGCNGAGEATVMRITSGPQLELNRCSDASCNSLKLDLSEALGHPITLAPKNERQVAAAYAFGKLVTVWRAGDYGGLRMRVAPPEAIASAEEFILLDDRIEAGRLSQKSTVSDIAIVPGDGFALVLLKTPRGILSIGVDSSGAPKAARVVGG